MLTYFNRLGKAASVAALTVGVAFAAVPAQKASAQFIGAGASSVTPLLKDSNSAGGSSPVWDYANSFFTPYTYYVTGSATGRQAFVNGSVDFVATEGTPVNGVIGSGTNAINLNDPNLVVVNEANINVILPFNVPGFNGRLTRVQVCNIINGQTPSGTVINNWNQVGGPNLPIIRVGRGDNSGTTAILQSSFIAGICNNPQNPLMVGGVPFGPNGGFANNPIPDITVGGSTGGVRIPNFNSATDILVAAPSNPFSPNPANDNTNSTGILTDPQFGITRRYGSYSLGVLKAVQANPGAIGYVERVINLNNGNPLLPFVTDTDNPGTLSTFPSTTLGVSPTYVIFRKSYNNATFNGTLKQVYAQDACYGAIFSGFLGNQNPGGVYPKRAGFVIDSRTFPYTPGPASRQAGTDTDNYGAETFNPFDFGPCGTIQP